MGTAPQSATSRGTGTRELAVIVNVVTAYQQVLLRLDPDTLTIDSPVAWLGVVPHARRFLEVPRSAIRGAVVAPAVFPSRLLVAAVIGGLPWFVPLPTAVVVACSLLGFLFLLLSVVASIRIDTTAGERHVVPVCWFERRAVQAFLGDLDGGGR